MDPHHELEQLRARVAHLESLIERLAGERPAVRREAAPAPEAGLDRRRMLRKGLGLSAAAVAGVGALDALGSAAAAADGDSVLVGQNVSPTAADSPPTRITNPSDTSHAAALLRLDNVTDQTPDLPVNTKAALVGVFSGHEAPPVNGVGVLGASDFGVGVHGTSDGDTGVKGTSPFGTGVSGTSQSGRGILADSNTGTAIEASSNSGRAISAQSFSAEAIHGRSTTDIGIVGEGAFGVVGTGLKATGAPGGTGVGAQGDFGVRAQGTTVGVSAQTEDGIAVQATSADGTAVQASSTTSTAVSGESGSWVGVRGISNSSVGVWGSAMSGAGMIATCGTGVGLDASCDDGPAIRADSTTGAALIATSSGEGPTLTASHIISGPALSASSKFGVGATLHGGRAAIRLVPKGGAGAPQTGDHQRGEVVVDNTGKLFVCTKPGTPGTWKQLAFV